LRDEVWGKSKETLQNRPIFALFADKSMSFIDRKHAFRWIKAMLLSDKSIEFIFRNYDSFYNALTINQLQNRAFSRYFQEKIISWKILQGNVSST